jgi:hypothetical protein
MGHLALGVWPFPGVLRYHVFVLADRAVHGKGIGACVERACYFVAS